MVIVPLDDRDAGYRRVLGETSECHGTSPRNELLANLLDQWLRSPSCPFESTGQEPRRARPPINFFACARPEEETRNPPWVALSPPERTDSHEPKAPSAPPPMPGVPPPLVVSPR
jgi:hypothetical protein